MKNRLKIFIVSLLLLPSLALSSGIPTVDVAAIAQNVLSYVGQLGEYAEEATRWQERIAHFKKQIQAYSDQLNATTGVKIQYRL